MNQTALATDSHDLRQLQDALKDGVLAIQTGTLWFRVRSNLPEVARSLHVLYAANPLSIHPDFCDFHVEVRQPPNLRRWLRPQAEFLVDDDRPFEPLPLDQAPALLEWGMNWTIAASCHQWFSLHAASLEKNGLAVIMPAPPGTGKSTLCALLALRGWRLLSDEITLLDPSDLHAQALARPINLKNASIDLIRKFEPAAVWSPETFDTKKGRVAHLRAPDESVRRMGERALPRWIVFPRYVPDAAPLLTPRLKTQTFKALADNAFNYSTLGETGFTTIAALLDLCDCYDFTYSRFDDALEVFDWLAQGGSAAEDPDQHTDLVS